MPGNRDPGRAGESMTLCPRPPNTAGPLRGSPSQDKTVSTHLFSTGNIHPALGEEGCIKKWAGPVPPGVNATLGDKGGRLPNDWTHAMCSAIQTDEGQKGLETGGSWGEEAAGIPGLRHFQGQIWVGVLEGTGFQEVGTQVECTGHCDGKKSKEAAPSMPL